MQHNPPSHPPAAITHPALPLQRTKKKLRALNGLDVSVHLAVYTTRSLHVVVEAQGDARSAQFSRRQRHDRLEAHDFNLTDDVCERDVPAKDRLLVDPDAPL
jgi:hypothetical protein